MQRVREARVVRSTGSELREGWSRRMEGVGLGRRREEGGVELKKTDVKSISTTKFLHRVFHNVLIILTDFLL